MSAATLFLLLVHTLFPLQLHVSLQLLFLLLHFFLVIRHHQLYYFLEDAVDVPLLLCTAVHKAPATLQHPFSLLIANLFLVDKISLVSHQHNAGNRLAVIFKLCDPVFDPFK